MTLKTDSYQIGLDSVTDNNNFLLQTNGAGNLHLHRGSSGVGDILMRIKPDNTVEFPKSVGSVIQIATYTDVGSTISSGSFVNVCAAFKNFTPKSSSSVLILDCTLSATVTAGGAGTNTTGVFTLYDNDGATVIGNSPTVGNVTGAGSNTQTHGSVMLRAIRTNNALTARSFTVRARYSTAACNISAQDMVWTITEIQA